MIFNNKVYNSWGAGGIEMTTYHSTTDETPICKDCQYGLWFRHFKCLINKNKENSFLYPQSCQYYRRRVE